MKTKKLTAKDFITIGIFTAIWFVVEFAFGILGYIYKSWFNLFDTCIFTNYY